VDVDPWLVRLNAVPSLGPLARTRLLGRFGSARAALEAPTASIARTPGIGAELAATLRAVAGEFDPEAEVEACRELEIRLIERGSETYPRALEFLPDPPPLLYVRGRLDAETSPAVAVIGARRCSSYGARQGRRFGNGLGREGVVVVSGLARGIDSAAHRGALEGGGPTVAVLGSGLDRIYPPEHAGLAAAIAEEGALISEFPLGAPPRKHHFPRRNRIIAGLCWGVVVVEAARRSGSIITANLALEGGREVFAVPGPVDSSLSHGTHRLIREGARLVEDPAEILADLGLSPDPAVDASEPPSDPVARRVLEAVPTDRAVAVEDLVESLGLPAAAVLAALGALFLEGRVAREDGHRWALA
jgi:DNA processing protein